MNVAWKKSQKIYSTEHCVRTLEEDFRLHTANPTGCVIKLPDLIALARPVDKDADPELIVDPKYWFSPSIRNCWHIYLLVGNILHARQLLPFELEWMSFERKNRLKIVPFQRFFSLCHDIRPLSIT